MTFKAVLNKVITKVGESESIQVFDKSRGEYTQYGTVVAIGSEVKDTCVGDVIVFSRLAGFKFEIAKQDYRVLQEQDVIMVSGANVEADNVRLLNARR